MPDHKVRGRTRSLFGLTCAEAKSSGKLAQSTGIFLGVFVGQERLEWFAIEFTTSASRQATDSACYENRLVNRFDNRSKQNEDLKGPKMTNDEQRVIRSH